MPLFNPDWGDFFYPICEYSFYISVKRPSCDLLLESSVSLQGTHKIQTGQNKQQEKSSWISFWLLGVPMYRNKPKWPHFVQNHMSDNRVSPWCLTLLSIALLIIIRTHPRNLLHTRARHRRSLTWPWTIFPSSASDLYKNTHILTCICRYTQSTTNVPDKHHFIKTNNPPHRTSLVPVAPSQLTK